MNIIIQFMKRNYKVLVLIGVFAIALWSFVLKDERISIDVDSDKDKILLEIVTKVLQSGHYNHFYIDDEFSKTLYASYLESLDPNKRFFIQQDIEEFSKYETQLDDQLLAKDISFFNLTYDRLKLRMKEAQEYYQEALKSPFNFEKDEELNLDFENAPYQKNKKALKERWRKQVKLSVLSTIYDKEKQQKGEDVVQDDVEDEEKVSQKKKAKESVEIKSFKELEKETRASELKKLNEYFEFMDEMDRDDWFAIYVNAITEQTDPHTNYMAPEDKESFDSSMSGKFEGIGARLSRKGDYIEVSELISGGPAWREGKLEAGDLIMKVGQDENAEFVDISGMRLDKAIKLIKGKKGTKVVLTVKKVDGSVVDIAITRDIVEIEETYVRSSIVTKGNDKYGIVYLPKFYFDVQDRKSRDAAKDMTQEIERLKKEQVKGIIIDLRNNGGGSLKTAVDISGLFIEKGPIVQVKNPPSRGGRAYADVDVHADTDSKIQWDGPLVVMVNSFSASASEIFAAAMQDYNRGIVIGSQQTYGKGTVQNFALLNNFIRNSDDDYGAIKITTQKFYRVNGGSTQLEGVKSDVVLPDRYKYVDVGEKDLKRAMPWDQIRSAKYNVFAPKGVFDKIIEKSKERVAQNPQFALIDKNAKWINDQKNDYDYSLNYKKFVDKSKKAEEQRKEFNKIKEYKNNLTFSSLPYELEQIKTDSLLAKKRERWHENLTKDIYVEEAVFILDDIIQNKN
ncbi:MAG: carboxy terminal-processing peptidase [Bacteroidota bacterium]|nr:carboxy terminal-processing peptidase [Bacteroidota bacterium]